MPEGTVRRGWALEAAWVFLFGLVRAPFFYYRAGQWDMETAVMGNLAQDLIDGLIMPVRFYHYFLYTHREIFMGFLLAPFYALLGRHYYVLFLVGWLVSLVLFWVWLRLVRTAFDAAAMHAFALLFVFCPLLFLDIGTRAWGNHFESLLPTGLALLLLNRAVVRGHRAGDLVLLGLVCGIGSFFCFQVMVTSALTFSLVVLSLPWSALLKRAGSLAGGFLIGFFPSLWFQWRFAESFGFNSARGELTVSSILAVTASSIVEKASQLLRVSLPVLPQFDSHFLNIFYMTAVLACGVALLFKLFPELRKLLRAFLMRKGTDQSPVRLALLTFPLAWLLSYLTNQHFLIPRATVFDFRYAVVLMPFMFVYVAASDRVLGSAGRYLAVAVLVLFSIFDRANLTFARQAYAGLRNEEKWFVARQYKATSPELFFLLQFPRYIEGFSKCDPEKVRAGPLRRLKPDYRSFGEEVIGWCAGAHGDCRSLTAGSPEDRKAGFDYALLGCARELAVDWIGRSPYRPAFLIPAEAAPERVRAEYWIGIGQGYVQLQSGSSSSREDVSRMFQELFSHLNETQLRLVAQGIGWYAAGYAQYNLENVLNFLTRRLSPETLDSFAIGFGRGAAQKVLFRYEYIKDVEGHFFRPEFLAAWSDRIPTASLWEGFQREMSDRGYHLTPVVPGGSWMKVEFTNGIE